MFRQQGFLAAVGTSSEPSENAAHIDSVSDWDAIHLLPLTYLFHGLLSEPLHCAVIKFWSEVRLPFFHRLYYFMALIVKKIVETDWNSHLITWNNCLLEFFKKNKIYLEYPWKIEGVYVNGAKFRIPKKLLVEKYANMPKGRVLGLGAFSYSRTVNMDVDFRCGRYCSIATNVSLSDQEHPLDRISTHPFSTHKHMVDFAAREFEAEVVIEPHNFLAPPLKLATMFG